MSDSVFSKANVLAALGLAGAAFTGYCIYYDFKRRSDPNYKQKIRENRRAKESVGNASRSRREIPSPNDPASMQQFFLDEMQLGEEQLGQGMVEEGCEHMATAIVMCGQPQQLLTILKQTLPSEHFEVLVSKIPVAEARIARMFSRADGHSQGPLDVEDDSPIEILGKDVAQVQELIDDDLE